MSNGLSYNTVICAWMRYCTDSEQILANIQLPDIFSFTNSKRITNDHYIKENIVCFYEQIHNPYSKKLFQKVA